MRRHRARSVLYLACPIVALTSPLLAQDARPRPFAEILGTAADTDWRTVDPENTLYLELPGGRVVIELAPDFAPRHVQNIRQLVRALRFDGGAIGRSQDNYVVQWSAVVDSMGGPTPGQGVGALPAEFEVASGALPFTPVPDGDVYAPEAGFTLGFPVGRDPATGTTWLAHCYGVVGVARGNDPGSGNGSALYVVIGHSPRHLDRNLTMVGRVVSGMEVLSILPRGSGNLGFYEDPRDRVPIRSIRVGTDVLPNEREDLRVLRTDTPLFREVIESRRHRSEDFFVHSVDRIELCNVPIPVR
ncbi:MAG: peptidylprolyl isomerase [Gemmatimonadota bacterium]|nr:peptidylprolyl isomerase [Gemmatimonadota bacterium]